MRTAFAIAIVVLVAMATYALAQPLVARVGFVASPQDRAEWELGVVTIHNLVALPDTTATYAIATPRGDVVISYQTTPNNGPDPTDIVTIISAPEGYLAIPSDFRVDEGATAEIRIIRFAGT